MKVSCTVLRGGESGDAQTSPDSNVEVRERYTQGSVLKAISNWDSHSNIIDEKLHDSLVYPVTQILVNGVVGDFWHFGRFLLIGTAMLDARMSLCDNSDLQNPSA